MDKLNDHYGYLLRNQDGDFILLYRVPPLKNTWLNINISDKTLPFNSFYNEDMTINDLVDILNVEVKAIYSSFIEVCKSYAEMA